MRDLQGKTYVVTGANAGIGKATAEQLAARGGHVVLCGRSASRTLPVVDAISAAGGLSDFVELDLASLSATRRAADELNERYPVIDVLINNAGLAGHQGQTEDGFELQFGVNHLGHFLLTKRLLPKLLKQPAARVVNVSSRNHLRMKKDIDYDAVRRPTATRVGLHEYDVSKLANVLMTKELAARYSDTGLRSYALNPGAVASDVWRRIPWPLRPLFIKLRRMKTNEEGAQTSVHCATVHEDTLDNGGYYEDCRRVAENPLALDGARARELWERSERWIADHMNDEGRSTHE